jgi:hypothetical protein
MSTTPTIADLQAALDAERTAHGAAFRAYREAEQRFTDALDAVIDAEDEAAETAAETAAPRPLPVTVAAAKRAVKEAKARIPGYPNTATKRSCDPKIRAAYREVRQAESDLYEVERAARIARGSRY